MSPVPTSAMVSKLHFAIFRFMLCEVSCYNSIVPSTPQPSIYNLILRPRFGTRRRSAMLISTLLLAPLGCVHPTAPGPMSRRTVSAPTDDLQYNAWISDIQRVFNRTNTITAMDQAFLIREFNGKEMQNGLLAGNVLCLAAKQKSIPAETFLRAVHKNLVRKRGYYTSSSLVLYLKFMDCPLDLTKNVHRSELKKLQMNCNNSVTLDKAEKSYIESVFQNPKSQIKFLGVELILFKDQLDPEDRDWFQAKIEEQQKLAGQQTLEVWKEISRVVSERK